MGKFSENPETTPSEGEEGPLTRGFSGPHVPILGIFGGSLQFKVGVGKSSGITDGEFVEIGVGKKSVGVAEFFPDLGFSPTKAGRALNMGVGMFGMDAGADGVDRGCSAEKHDILVCGNLVSAASPPVWGSFLGSKPVFGKHKATSWAGTPATCVLGSVAPCPSPASGTTPQPIEVPAMPPTASVTEDMSSAACISGVLGTSFLNFLVGFPSSKVGDPLRCRRFRGCRKGVCRK